MRLPFLEVPGDVGGVPRPVLPVQVAGLGPAEACLVDTGSLANRFDREVAELCEVDLADGERTWAALGGFRTECLSVRVPLVVVDTEGDPTDLAWEAVVSFCHPWPVPFGILGQEGFLRYFRVTLRAAAYEIDVAADPG